MTEHHSTSCRLDVCVCVMALAPEFRPKHPRVRDGMPWLHTWTDMQQRCTNPNKKSYHRYGGRGIKALITKEELRELWFRDKAYLMDQPSIDRIDNSGHYTFANCRYVERRVNSTKTDVSQRTHCRHGHELVGKNLCYWPDRRYDPPRMRRRCLECCRILDRKRWPIRKHCGVGK